MRSVVPSSHPLALIAALLSCLVLAGIAEARAGTDALRIRVDPSVSYQTINGFGASDAWQCAFVGRNWPLQKRERIADLLFSREVDAQGHPKGIGLSIWRFNIGAGTAEQGDASDIKNPWRRAECFQNADGSYDWSKQAGQRWFLQAARRRGVEKFLAFANSPPVHLTRNGRGYADKGPPHFNIKPGAFEKYAAFLADVLEHFEKEGLHFDYLSPFNEPQWDWDEPSQEGTPAQNVELYALIRYLSAKLSQRKLTTQMVIGEAGTIGHAFMSMDSMVTNSAGRDDQAQFFFNPRSPFYIGDLPNVASTISAHSYFSVWPLDKQVEYRRLLHQAFQAANPKLGYWMSEYCVMESNEEIRSGSRRDLGMDTALFVARIIHHDLTTAHASSWQWWTALSQVDFKDGLVYLDDGSKGDGGRMGTETVSLRHDGVVRESKLLWAFGNYARFIRPGMVRVSCAVEPEQSHVDGVLASAYKGPGGKLAVVLVNLSRQPQPCDLGTSRQVEVYTTSDKASLQRTLEPGPRIVVPPRAVLTCIYGHL